MPRQKRMARPNNPSPSPKKVKNSPKATVAHKPVTRSKVKPVQGKQGDSTPIDLTTTNDSAAENTTVSIPETNPTQNTPKKNKTTHPKQPVIDKEPQESQPDSSVNEPTTTPKPNVETAKLPTEKMTLKIVLPIINKPQQSQEIHTPSVPERTESEIPQTVDLEQVQSKVDVVVGDTEASQTVTKQKKTQQKSITDVSTSDSEQVQLKVRPVVSDTNSSQKLTKQKLSAQKALSVLSHIDPASSPTNLVAKFKIIGPANIHWETLTNLQVDNQFNDWLSPAWKKLFSINRPVYKKLMIEFFSTYRFNENMMKMQSVKTGPVMSFSLGGKLHTLNFKQFAKAMNLYSEEEVEGEEFEKGLTEWPTNVTLNEFWRTFGKGEYDKNVSCTKITKPTYRILHRLISESIAQRGSCTNLVTQKDMKYMYFIVNNKACNIAKCLAQFLYKSAGKSDSSAVCGAAYVTELAIGLGAYTEEQLAGFEVLATPLLFDEAQLRKLLIVEKNPPLRFADPDSVDKVQVDVGTSSDLASRVTCLEGDVRSLKSYLQWTNSALHFLIGQSGQAFEPPPHLVARGQSAHQNTSTVNENLSASGQSPN